MRKEHFQQLVTMLAPYIERQTTTMREAIRPDHRVGIAINALATRTDYRTLANLMGVGKSTVCEITLEVSAVLANVFAPRWICMPKTIEELNELVEKFHQRWNFPACLGALDGTHYEFMAPHKTGEAVIYFDRKKNTSIQAQILCGYNLKFLNVYCGSAGSAHDAQIFRWSNLFHFSYIAGCWLYCYTLFNCW